MKKYLSKLALFCGIVALVDFGFGLTCGWLQEHAKGGVMKSINQIAIEETADIVVMGSSRAHHHYDPSVICRITKMSTYNGGVDGNGIVLSLGLYEMIRERYTPKVILYEVTPEFDINVYSDDNNARYIGWLRPYYKKTQIMSILCRIDPYERYKNYSSMFRYNSKIIDLLKNQIVGSHQLSNGFEPLDGCMIEDRERSKKPEPPTDSVKIKMLEEFMTQVDKTGTKLVLIASPKYGEINSDEFTKVKNLSAKHGIEFWDYYTTPLFQEMDFFKEPTHLNSKGAAIFSEEIANRILSLTRDD